MRKIKNLLVSFACNNISFMLPRITIMSASTYLRESFSEAHEHSYAIVHLLCFVRERQHDGDAWTPCNAAKI